MGVYSSSKGKKTQKEIYEQMFDVELVIIHKDYDPFRDENDIALMKLKRDAQIVL